MNYDSWKTRSPDDELYRRDPYDLDEPIDDHEDREPTPAPRETWSEYLRRHLWTVQMERYKLMMRRHWRRFRPRKPVVDDRTPF